MVKHNLDVYFLGSAEVRDVIIDEFWLELFRLGSELKDKSILKHLINELCFSSAQFFEMPALSVLLDKIVVVELNWSVEDHRDNAR